MSVKSGLNIVTDGLIFQVDAANGLGGNVTDTKNIVTPTEVGTFVNGVAVISGNYDFDGVDDYIDISSSLTVVQSSSTGTIDAWVVADVLVDGERILGLGGDVANAELFTLEIRNIGGNFRFALTSAGIVTVDADVLNGSTNLVAGTMYNIVIKSNGSNYEMYLNDVQETLSVIVGLDSGVWLDAPTPVNPILSIGAVKNASLGLFWNGTVSNLKIYNTDLTATEISQNYEALKHRFE